MTQRSIEATQGRLEHITRRWWFFVLLLQQQIVPSYTAGGHRPEETGLVIGEILSNCYLYEIPFLHPVFKLLPVVLVLLLILLGNRIARVFSIYAAINHALIAVLQSVGVSDVVGFRSPKC